MQCLAYASLLTVCALALRGFLVEHHLLVLQYFSQNADCAVTYHPVMPQAVPPALLKLCTSAPLPAYGAIQGDVTGTLTQVGYLSL
jgi:hypothetical protein